MMRIFILVLLVLCFLPVSAQAQKNLLAVDLAEDHVDITTGFNGVHLTMFGVKEEAGDIAVTISGPLRKTIVRKKENVLGVWLNRRSMSFRNVPVYYNFSTSAPLEKVADEDVLSKNRIGTTFLKFEHEDKPQIDIAAFEDALLRNKQSQKLFSVEGGEVEFIDKNFFRTSFYIPSNAPIGDYTVKTYLIREGAVKETKMMTVKVAQVGLSAAIFEFARDWSFAYGFLCVAFAVSIGWLSSIFRLVPR